MKKLSLNEILTSINVDGRKDDCLIEKVTDKIGGIDFNTVVFHLDKGREINNDRFLNVKNCFIITDQPLLKHYPKSEYYIFVPDIKKAYAAFVHYYRSLFAITVIAVTGTCGKTTTKEMISQVLKTKHQVVHTLDSKNGLRYHHTYLTAIDEKTEFAVLETAITHPGHLIYTCDFFKPQIGIITNVGIDHLNWCNTNNNYLRTKGELLVGLNNQGTLIINNDDKNLKKLDMSRYCGQIITYGIINKADFRAKQITFEKDGMSFVLLYQNMRYPVFIPCYGIHNVENALAALAALTRVGLSVDEIIALLKQYQPVRSHVEIKKGLNHSLIIDDTWSSNPTSTQAALNTLKVLGEGKTKIAVIGKIAYLGRHESKSYELIAKMLLKSSDIIVTSDPKSAEIGAFAHKLGFAQRRIINCFNPKELMTKLFPLLNEKTVVLFKMSMLDRENSAILTALVQEPLLG